MPRPTAASWTWRAISGPAADFVLKRKDSDHCLDMVCSGLPNLAVRMPNHPLALQLIKASGVPIAAPSANRFKTVSPTTARHVSDSLGNKVDMILDGGPCKIGVETTIVDLTGREMVILRAGGLPKEELEAFTGEKVYLSDGNPDKPSAPGQLLKHYAPGLPLRINVTEDEVRPDEFFIGFGSVSSAHLNLSPQADLREAAANLFAFMREAEKHREFSGIAISLSLKAAWAWLSMTAFAGLPITTDFSSTRLNYLLTIFDK